MRLTTNKLLMPILGGLMFLASCSLPALQKQAPGINEVKLGTKFRINLPEDHRTGYSWLLDDDFDHAVVEPLNVVWHGNETGIDFNFVAKAVGETSFSLVNRKYTDTSGSVRFVVKIVPN